MKSIKYSFIVPVYNVEKYVEKCLISLLNQSYINYEIIIVDDGSTDKSIDIIKKYNSNKIKIFHKKNGGLSSARNYGIEKSTGDYIWFVDSDDYIAFDALSNLNNYIKNKNYDIVIFKQLIDRNGKIEEHCERFWNDYDAKKILTTVSACSKVYKTSFFKKNQFKFIDGKIYEDLELIPYVLSKSNNILYINTGLYYYVQRNGSIMNAKSKFNKNRDDKFIVINRLFQKFKNDNIYEEYKEELIYLMIRHLILVTSTEIMIFSKSIYLPRCQKIINLLNQTDSKWFKNKYIDESPMFSRLYIMLFRKKLFKICALIIRIRNIQSI